MQITMTLNGASVDVDVPPMKRLLDVLREDAGLTGTKEGCGEGECGACSVIIDGEVANSCLIPAIQAQGASVITVEGLADKEREALHPVQQTFIAHGGAQCGICTPGMLVAAKVLLDRDPDPSRESIREAIAGNLCRCTGYQKIVDAIEDAAEQIRES